MSNRTARWKYVECYHQPLWAYARAWLFHRTVCVVFGRWRWNLVRTDGWPDTACFELSNARRSGGREFEVPGTREEVER